MENDNKLLFIYTTQQKQRKKDCNSDRIHFFCWKKIKLKLKQSKNIGYNILHLKYSYQDGLFWETELKIAWAMSQNFGNFVVKRNKWQDFMTQLHMIHDVHENLLKTMTTRICQHISRALFWWNLNQEIIWSLEITALDKWDFDQYMSLFWDQNSWNL